MDPNETYVSQMEAHRASDLILDIDPPVIVHIDVGCTVKLRGRESAQRMNAGEIYGLPKADAAWVTSHGFGHVITREDAATYPTPAPVDQSPFLVEFLTAVQTEQTWYSNGERAFVTRPQDITDALQFVADGHARRVKESVVGTLVSKAKGLLRKPVAPPLADELARDRDQKLAEDLAARAVLKEALEREGLVRRRTADPDPRLEGLARADLGPATRARTLAEVHTEHTGRARAAAEATFVRLVVVPAFVARDAKEREQLDVLMRPVLAQLEKMTASRVEADTANCRDAMFPLPTIGNAYGCWREVTEREAHAA